MDKFGYFILVVQLSTRQTWDKISCTTNQNVVNLPFLPLLGNYETKSDSGADKDRRRMEPVVADRQPVREPLERRGGGVRPQRRGRQEAVQVLHQPHAAGRRHGVPG